mmetsp:Transcript_92251/g.152799  ORF Transcript_92251/g.152799 Transcript_92251/m.152799 type:complete len:97 (-) Transcript_92251:99-389(-)
MSPRKAATKKSSSRRRPSLHVPASMRGQACLMTGKLCIVQFALVLFLQAKMSEHCHVHISFMWLASTPGFERALRVVLIASRTLHMDRLDEDTPVW